MPEHITFDNMERNVEYECLKYRPIFARSGLYYCIQVKKVGDNDNKRTMIITDGCIFDKLEQFRTEFTRCKFSFKKIEVDALNNSVNDIIIIMGDHDSVILG